MSISQVRHPVNRLTPKWCSSLETFHIRSRNNADARVEITKHDLTRTVQGRAKLYAKWSPTNPFPFCDNV